MSRSAAVLVSFFSLLLISLLLLLPNPPSASANPGFARKFGFSCVMCHAGFPKLNPFGEAFAKNGYQMPGGDVTTQSQSFGDSNLSLEKNLNLAVRVDSYLRYRADTSVHSDIESPFLVKLFIIGYLAKDITFYSYFLAGEGGEVVGMEDAFLYLSHLGGTDSYLQIGQFQVMDPVYSREQRLTFQDIEIYVTHVSKSNFELTYQRGATLSYGYGPVDFVLGAVNGNGIGRQDQNGNFDNNSPKDIFGRLGFSAGPVTAGLFGYLGREREETTRLDNTITRYGPDLRIRNWIKGLDLRSQWLFGREANPDFLVPAERARLSGGFVELDYHFNSDWTGILLYNDVSSKDRAAVGKRLGTVNLTHYFRRNMKAFLEYTHDFKKVSDAHPEKTDTALLGLVFAF
ncbi:MAG: hypothetical protein HY282_05540 [Nitrospirae bacterium]|nr:hypothetical protein [Candidatus Manganitrophaceae bacterium]